MLIFKGPILVGAPVEEEAYDLERSKVESSLERLQLDAIDHSASYLIKVLPNWSALPDLY